MGTVYIKYQGPSLADCYDAGSSPIAIDNLLYPNNTNVTVAIFDDDGSIQLIDGGFISANPMQDSKSYYLQLKNTQSRVQVWLTSVCANPNATSKEIFPFYNLIAPNSTDQTKNTVISSTYNSASVLGVGCVAMMMMIVVML